MQVIYVLKWRAGMSRFGIVKGGFGYFIYLEGYGTYRFI